MRPAQKPQRHTPHNLPCPFHTYTSIAPGQISSSLQSSGTISPSPITTTGASSANSTRFTPRRDASGCSMCVPSYNRGSIRINPSRPIGPQRTYSINPSLGSAFGAINIVPPVNLLLLNVKNRQRRSSHSLSSSQRILNGRRFNCATFTNTPSKYPKWPNGLNIRFVIAPTSAVNPTLSRLKEYSVPPECRSRNRSTLRLRPAFSASNDHPPPLSPKSLRKEFPVPNGKNPSSTFPTGDSREKMPLMISCAVPSPPTAKNRR